MISSMLPCTLIIALILIPLGSMYHCLNAAHNSLTVNWPFDILATIIIMLFSILVCSFRYKFPALQFKTIEQLINNEYSRPENSIWDLIIVIVWTGNFLADIVVSKQPVFNMLLGLSAFSAVMSVVMLSVRFSQREFFVAVGYISSLFLMVIALTGFVFVRFFPNSESKFTVTQVSAAETNNINGVESQVIQVKSVK